ncbi:hypothetical protein [Bradyrhizobium sp. Ash2021]|uniref:hypothetical protein n=1 Tax=Bradyrhizobium sp. Ash2021 TaxID=2954771 RepID=UPI0028150C9D|nr:hypothetical protein [Bradyrhizobium sp. Ash2021]WMT72580.1 hypothetical protein NL528_31790 [Bradyrhizobium sp. Ash2021]
MQLRFSTVRKAVVVAENPSELVTQYNMLTDQAIGVDQKSHNSEAGARLLNDLGSLLYRRRCRGQSERVS